MMVGRHPTVEAAAGGARSGPWPQLGELGVARVTYGGGLHMAATAAVERLAARLRDQGDPYGRGA